MQTVAHALDAAGYFCVSADWVYVCDFDFHMLSAFSAAYKNYEAFDAGYAFPVRAYLADVHFVFFAYGDWAISSAAFVFGVSWASLSRTDRTFSPLFYTLTVIS